MTDNHNSSEKPVAKKFKFPDIIDVSHDFAYKTLDIKLHRSSKTVEASFRKEYGHLNLEVIKELLDLSNWLSDHIEVQSFILTHNGENFCLGFNRDEIANYQIEEVTKLNQALVKIIRAFYHLPQTLIAKIQGQVANEGMELLLPFDLRIATEPPSIKLSYLEDGHCPGPALSVLLPQIVGEAMAKKWLYTGTAEGQDLLNSGFITDINFTVDKYLKMSILHSPLTRMQTKRAMLETVLPVFDKIFPVQSNFMDAALVNHDYKEANLAKKETRNPKFGDVRNLKDNLKRNKKAEVNH